MFFYCLSINIYYLTVIKQYRIKELRARDNLAQLDLAKRVDVRRETIVFVEKGKYNPSLKLAYDIAQVFKLNIDEVFIFADD